MSAPISKEILESYSRGEITRREIGAQVGVSVGFGALIGQLHQHKLPIPRLAVERNLLGIDLVASLARRIDAHD